jgi:putative aldouronate transport system permease protein
MKMSDIGNAAVLNKKKLKDGIIKSRKTRAGDLVIAGICFILMLVCILPMLHVLASSLSSADALVKNEVFIWPKGWNVEAYRTVLTTEKYVHSMGWTAILTVICTLLSITLTIMCAYPLTYTNLRGGKFLNFIILFTMYFSAGMIPHYVMLSNLGMLETVWVLVLPSCLSVYNMIIMRSSFYSVPESLREAAEIDGAGPVRTLVQIYLPLSKPVLATLALFYAVGRWNGFSDALLYIKKTRDLYPIQLYLYNILQNASSGEAAAQEGFTMPGLSETLKMASVMFATVPILLVYPWLQRYFVAGVTIGAVKG